MRHVNGWWEGVLRLKSNNRLSLLLLLIAIYVHTRYGTFVSSYPLRH